VHSQLADLIPANVYILAMFNVLGQVHAVVRRRGRLVSSEWKVHLFLLAKNNDDFVPSVAEQNRLTRNGLGS